MTAAVNESNVIFLPKFSLCYFCAQMAIQRAQEAFYGHVNKKTKCWRFVFCFVLLNICE